MAIIYNFGMRSCKKLLKNIKYFFCLLFHTNIVELFGNIDPSIIFLLLMSKHVGQKNRHDVTLF